MKTYIGILLFALSVCANAQIDSAVSFYPLQTGNVWQYWYHYQIKNTNQHDSSYVMAKVVADTLMPNGKWYKIIDGKILGAMRTRYQRVDSLTACVYSYYYDGSDVLTDSLQARRQDRFGMGFRCINVDTVPVFGIVAIRKEFAGNLTPSPYLTIAQGIGIVKAVTSVDNPVYPVVDAYTYDLVYAKIGGKEYGALTTVRSQEKSIPTSFGLEQNFPNPFNSSTKICLSIPCDGLVQLKVYSALGQQVATLISQELSRGFHEISWDASKVPTGVYFYRLMSGVFTETKRLIVLK